MTFSHTYIYTYRIYTRVRPPEVKNFQSLAYKQVSCSYVYGVKKGLFELDPLSLCLPQTQSTPIMPVAPDFSLPPPLSPSAPQFSSRIHRSPTGG